jgi:predicted nucleic acid-binding Zn ribbon protein
VRRQGPRPITAALDELTRRIEPLTLIARVQRVWDDVAGELVAEETRPVSEGGGTVTIACNSSTWAGELQMLSGDYLKRLNEDLGASPEHPFVTHLKFVYESPTRRG